MANRGIVVYAEPRDVAKAETILASETAYLLSVLLVTMNERDSIARIINNPDNYGAPLAQLGGIADAAKATEMNSVRAAIVVNTPVYAAYINSIIKYTNEMVNTCGGQASQVSTVTCTYPYATTIIKVEPEIVIPDVQKVDPITGVGIVDELGEPVMVAGLRNPIPVLDSEGEPTYYTISLLQIFTEGPVIIIPETTSNVNLCGNISIVCPNRVKQYDWKNEGSSDDPGYVWICNNILRQEVIYVSGALTGAAIPSVAVGGIIYASTFDAISTNLRLISAALDSYIGFWRDGLCVRTCQVSCQRPCMLSCQSCYGGTCHNQNCGGWS